MDYVDHLLLELKSSQVLFKSTFKDSLSCAG